ncbi:hypothetical protein F5X96DRAFT_663125 [Biscogniauxia mediterranea]|nr:hypothetical protein F5X96DRAFT_663125 [Biscogniauxia mediterranea]
MCVPLWEQDRCAQQDCDKPVGKARIVRYRRCNKLPRGVKPRNCEHLNQRGECIRLSPVKYCSKECELADLGEVFDAVKSLRTEAKELERKQKKHVKLASKIVQHSETLAKKTKRVLRKRRGNDDSEDDDDDDREDNQDGYESDEQESDSDNEDSMEWESEPQPSNTE